MQLTTLSGLVHPGSDVRRQTAPIGDGRARTACGERCELKAVQQPDLESQQFARSKTPARAATMLDVSG
jgi:hypothetical protein